MKLFAPLLLAWIVWLVPFFASQGAERPAEVFILCSQKRATGLALRTIIVHYISEEEKCVAVYSREGQSSALAYGKWLGHCRKKAEETRLRLEKSLWKCGEQPAAKVFYSDRQSGGE